MSANNDIPEIVLVPSNTNAQVTFFFDSINRFHVNKFYESFTEQNAREMSAYEQLSHPLMVQRYRNDDLNKSASITLDLITGGSLESILVFERQGKIVGWDLTQKMIVAYGVSRFLRIMEEKNFIYRDLKPGNILLDHDLRPVICDFESLKRHIKDESNTICGTRVYSSPEVMTLTGSYGFQSCVYAFASVLFTMLTFRIPFLEDYLVGDIDAPTVMENDIIIKKKPQIDRKDPLFIQYPEIPKFLDDCWKLDPINRPSIKELPELFEKIARSTFSNEDDIRRFEEYKSFVDQNEKKSDAKNGENGTTRKDGTIENLIIAANRGIPFSRMILGIAKILGTDIEKDFKEGLKLYVESLTFFKVGEKEIVEYFRFWASNLPDFDDMLLCLSEILPDVDFENLSDIDQFSNCD